ncbi:hypothetical protein SNE94_002226 [Vibrio cholerae]|nr:hypothetical protein [Vibrio cholerae]
MEFLGHIKRNPKCDLLSSSVKSKKRKAHIIKSIEHNLNLAYSRYASIISKFNIEPSKTAFSLYSDTLIDFYEHPPKELESFIIDRRRNHGLLECPFCGRPNPPTTLDHFIPKDYWPEYSIFPNNLVPQCNICAPTKGKKYFCKESNAPLFLHPIFHQSLSKIKFNIEIDFNDTTKEYKFDVYYNIPKITLHNKYISKRIKSHLYELNVQNNIILYCHKNIFEWIIQLKKKKFSLEQALRTKLEQTPENQIGNNWETALYNALLATPNMIKYMESHAPRISSPPVSEPSRTIVSF